MRRIELNQNRLGELEIALDHNERQIKSIFRYLNHLYFDLQHFRQRIEGIEDSNQRYSPSRFIANQIIITKRLIRKGERNLNLKLDERQDLYFVFQKILSDSNEQMRVLQNEN